MIQLIIIGLAALSIFFGGLKTASIYYKGKIDSAKAVVQEDQTKKTKASQDSAIILNDFGNEEQLKSDAIADQMTNEVDEEDAKAPKDIRNDRVILSREWLRKLDSIR